MPPRRSKLFPTPDDAETAFYEAFERGDAAAMMAVWAESDSIVCIHPRGPRLLGFEAVRESWTRIFSGGARARVRATETRRFDGQGIAVHTLIEILGGPGDRESQVCATNVFELTDGGWRMVIHHATPLEQASGPQDAPAGGPHTLH